MVCFLNQLVTCYCLPFCSGLPTGKHPIPTPCYYQSSEGSCSIHIEITNWQSVNLLVVPSSLDASNYQLFKHRWPILLLRVRNLKQPQGTFLVNGHGAFQKFIVFYSSLTARCNQCRQLCLLAAIRALGSPAQCALPEIEIMHVQRSDTQKRLYQHFLCTVHRLNS